MLRVQPCPSETSEVLISWEQSRRTVPRAMDRRHGNLAELPSAWGDPLQYRWKAIRRKSVTTSARLMLLSPTHLVWHAALAPFATTELRFESTSGSSAVGVALSVLFVAVPNLGWHSTIPLRTPRQTVSSYSEMPEQHQVDLLVVGGGINGVGIARDAAGQGLSVCLIEQSDLAGFTSSASTKLIHGGLRYLEYREFRLVREALTERERLLGIAPHLIRPLRFVLPYTPGPAAAAGKFDLGLFVYDHVGGRRRLPASTQIRFRRRPERRATAKRHRCTGLPTPIAASMTAGWSSSTPSMRRRAARLDLHAHAPGIRAVTGGRHTRGMPQSQYRPDDAGSSPSTGQCHRGMDQRRTGIRRLARAGSLTADPRQSHRRATAFRGRSGLHPAESRTVGSSSSYPTSSTTPSSEPPMCPSLAIRRMCGSRPTKSNTCAKVSIGTSSKR